MVLSSTDKNSKIPILHDYMKRTKVAIAPDVPPKQMAAWTVQGQALGPDQVNVYWQNYNRVMNQELNHSLTHK